MGTFAAGHMLDPYTGRPLAAQEVRVLAYPTDLPVTPDSGPVFTGARGGYGRFTVAGLDAVTLVASDGTAVDLVSVEAQTHTPITLGAPVPTAADLPVSGERPGAARITQDTGHLWQWDGTAWVDLGSVAGPKGDKGDPGLNATGAIVAITTATYTVPNDGRYLATVPTVVTVGGTPVSLVRGQLLTVQTIAGAAWYEVTTLESSQLLHVLDTFNRPDSADLGKTEVGGLSWVKATGDMVIEGKHLAAPVLGSGPGLSLLQTAHSDGVLTARLNTSENAMLDSSVMLRRSGTAEQADEWLLSLVLTESTNMFALRSRPEGGALTVAEQVTGVMAPNRVWDIEAVLDGPQITCRLTNVGTGQVVASLGVSSSFQQAGVIHGVRSPHSTAYGGNRWASFRLEGLA